MMPDSASLPKVTAFVSYSRKNSAMLATHIESQMTKRGLRGVFVDTRMTDGAGPFPERLHRAIEACKVFVCLLGETTLDSKWVLEEIRYAHELGKPMLPIFQENYVPITEPPTPAVAALLQSDGIHIFDQKNLYIDRAMDDLAQTIRRTLDGNSPRRRTPLIGFGALVVVALLIAALVIVSPRLSGSTSQTPTGTASVTSANTAANTVIAARSTDTATPTPPTPTLKPATAAPTIPPTLAPSNTSAATFTIPPAIPGTANLNGTEQAVATQNQIAVNQTPSVPMPTTVPIVIGLVNTNPGVNLKIREYPRTDARTLALAPSQATVKIMGVRSHDVGIDTPMLTLPATSRAEVWLFVSWQTSDRSMVTGWAIAQYFDIAIDSRKLQGDDISDLLALKQISENTPGVITSYHPIS